MYPPISKPVLLALALILGHPALALAQMAEIESLLDRLADPETEDWKPLERQIVREWSKSGSATMDLLLKRGREALDDGKHGVALEHFTALTDHAPDFAEGWNARAQALVHMEMYGPAIEDIGKALALNPRHFGAMTGLTAIFNELDMAEEALEILRMVRDVHPNLPGLERSMGIQEENLDGERL